MIKNHKKTKSLPLSTNYKTKLIKTLPIHQKLIKENIYWNKYIKNVFKTYTSYSLYNWSSKKSNLHHQISLYPRDCLHSKPFTRSCFGFWDLKYWCLSCEKLECRERSRAPSNQPSHSRDINISASKIQNKPCLRFESKQALL